MVEESYEKHFNQKAKVFTFNFARVEKTKNPIGEDDEIGFNKEEKRFKTKNIKQLLHQPIYERSYTG